MQTRYKKEAGSVCGIPLIHYFGFKFGIRVLKNSNSVWVRVLGSKIIKKISFCLKSINFHQILLFLETTQIEWN
jgi:hypothetical protein